MLSLEKADLLRIIVEKNFNINPEALRYLLGKKITEEELEVNLEQLSRNKLVINLEDVKKFNIQQLKIKPIKDNIVDVLPETEDKILGEKFKGLKPVRNPPEITILLDIPEKALEKPDITSFRNLFINRYQQLIKILKSNIDETPAIISQNLSKDEVPEGREGIIIGMVQDTRVLHTNRFVIQLEDLATGINTRCVMVEDSKSFPSFRKIIRDTVVGIRGVLPKNYIEGPINAWWGKDIIRPGVVKTSPKTSNSSSGNILILGDIHFGSKHFSRSIFTNLLKFLNLETSKKDLIQISENISTIIIAGDLVEGIGHFQDQKNDLITKSLQSQYEGLAKLLEDIPKEIKIIIIPGERDATQTALPQPSIDKKIGQPLISLPNVQSYGNPVQLQINGRICLLFHGNGLDFVFERQFNLKKEDYFTGLENLLEYRHLYPEYGSFYPLAPFETDYLVIDRIPDIMVTGHFHQVGYKEYKGIKLVLPGTFVKDPKETREKSALFPVYSTDRNTIQMVDLRII